MNTAALKLGTIVCVLAAALASCASYTPQPLSEHPELRSSVQGLVVDAGQFPLPERGTHHFDPRRPLDANDIAMIAVANNSDLRAARTKLGVAQAQVFAAGILPNPHFGSEYGFLIGGPGTTNLVLAGLSQEIVPLLTLSTRKQMARAGEVSVELNVAWQEWQIVSRARTLFVDAVCLGEQYRLIAENLQLFRERYQRSYRAMHAGNEVLPTVTSDLVALNSAESQLNEIDQLILKTRHDLNAVLGLTPEAMLRLADGAPVPALDAGKLESSLIDLAGRRPDLLALRAGYQAQEEKVRLAVIEQFPRLSVGSNFLNDTTGIQSQSAAITISLPIFDRNQGNIAIERATREQLRQEYQARLNAAYGEAIRLIAELRLFEDQYRQSIESVRRLREAVATADPAFIAKNLDERTFVDLRTSLLAREIATARLRQSILQRRVGLQTLIGSRLPNQRIDLPRRP